MIRISKLLLIDELSTIEHVKSLAFNRSASSTGETQARMYIEKELAKENIDSKVEYFSWAGSTRVLMRISYLIIYGLSLFICFESHFSSFIFYWFLNIFIWYYSIKISVDLKMQIR